MLRLAIALIAALLFLGCAQESDGQIFSFMVMCVAAAEVSVGLAIVIALFRNKATVNLDEINLMKW